MLIRHYIQDTALHQSKDNLLLIGTSKTNTLFFHVDVAKNNHVEVFSIYGLARGCKKTIFEEARRENMIRKLTQLECWVFPI